MTVSGTFYRCADYDTPVWSRPNDLSGRWHTADRRTSAQYWSYSPLTAWAERLRATGVTDENDVVEIRGQLWVGQVSFTAIANLTDQAWLDWLHVTAEALIEDNHDGCRRIGALLRERGASGLIAPSAAKPDGLNLVIFKRLVRGDWHERPEGSPADLRFPEQVIPVRPAAIGYPPPGLVHGVRYRASTVLGS
jgi:RES domain-containing protein